MELISTERNVKADCDEQSFVSTVSTNTPSSGWSETSNSATLSPGLSFHKPRTTSDHDPYWNAIHNVHSEAGMFNLQNLNFIQKLGSGDIGTVYLAELKGAKGCMFAAKVMDKEELANRKKENRAKIEREILEMVDHPFLPTLYTTLDSARWFCLLTEFCPGGDLHILRKRQPGQRFDEAAVRFYTSEVVAVLEYLHMIGIIYRDLKPENVLVRSDGHIMLTDFDLCLKCDNTKSEAQLVSKATNHQPKYCPFDASIFAKSSCILSNCIVPAVSCFQPRPRRRRKPSHHGALRVVTEPIEARSMSFVGTHEYLAPEIVSGEGHGSSVDWWTLGIFMYELFYGVTPFRGFDNEFTLANIVARGLEFPKEPALASSAKDLITQLLTKNPIKRMGSTMGATAIKNHPFFDGVNWSLLRCTTPPNVPQPLNYREYVSSCDYDASLEYY